MCRGKGLMTDSTWCAKQLWWRSMHFSVAFSISNSRLDRGVRTKYERVGLLHSTMSPILVLFRSHADACIWLSRITLVLKLTVANSHGICGVHTKWKKTRLSVYIQKSSTICSIPSFLPKNFSTMLIVWRYSFPFFLWSFLSLLIFFSLPFRFSPFFHI